MDITSSTGTFGGSELLSEEADCTQCEGGYYCESPGEASAEGECDEGFYCTIGETDCWLYLLPFLTQILNLLFPLVLSRFLPTITTL